MRGQIVKNGIYHVLNRGVDKHPIFLDGGDYLRFVKDLFDFNDSVPAVNIGYYFSKKGKTIDFGSRYNNKNKRKPLVDILAFVLMPNHYHLLLKPKTDEGLISFMRKLNIGYAKYFNEKHERTGALFQGRYRSIQIKNERHFIHLPYYIHCNPLDLFMPQWRNGKIKDYKKAMGFLENYQWSSFPDYIGKSVFSVVTQRSFLISYFGGQDIYRQKMLDFLKDIDVSIPGDYTLE